MIVVSDNGAAQARSVPGLPRRNTAIGVFSPEALRDFLTARFSLMDLPAFLLADCRGDLSVMTLLPV
jgi:hypothetical protein